MAARIGVTGAAGRMGRMLVAAVHGSDDARLVGATARPGSEAVGQDAGAVAGIGAIGVTIGDDAPSLFAAADAVVDFTAPAASVEHAVYAAQGHTALVLGTSGLDADQTAEVRKAARHAPIVWAPNTSVGVNLLLGLVRRAAAALGPDWDIEIVEMHHRNKVDAPSGTALALGEAAAAGRGVDLEAHMDSGRHGHTGPRETGRIGFAALRGGDVIGEHTVVFAGPSERLELGHRAAGRHIYAAGAVRAALWAVDREPGLYSMADVLGLD